jgi:hypothetical protein
LRLEFPVRSCELLKETNETLDSVRYRKQQLLASSFAFLCSSCCLKRARVCGVKRVSPSRRGSCDCYPIAIRYETPYISLYLGTHFMLGAQAYWSAILAIAGGGGQIKAIHVFTLQVLVIDFCLIY